MKENVLFVGACCSFGFVLADSILSEYAGVILVEQQSKETELNYLVEKLNLKYPEKKIYTSIIDIKDTKQIAERILELENKNINIDKMVFCAGLNIITGALEVTEEIWDEILDVNLKGYFFVTQAVIASMIRKGIRGSVVAVASQHAVVANYNRAPYCAAKAGEVHLSKELAMEFAENGIRINVVSPSYIKSAANENLLNTARSKKEYLDQILLKRYAVPEDIANAVIFLLSDKSDYLTGVNLLVDGGYTIK